ncbi:MAG: hypothetical protein K9L86_03980 [Candidatus Omnitrophica bacterium]|nr:hypothetical protein [Candidatus Omnitrophota bacterium]
MKNRLNKKARGNRRIFGAFGVLILAALFLSSSYFFEYSFAQTHPFLKYFPANEEIITYSTDGFSGYPLALTEITNCTPPSFGGVDLFKALADCNACMGWKEGCADCCINPTTPPEYFCAPSATDPGPSGGYNPVPFSENCDGSTRVSCTTCGPTFCGLDPVFDNCTGFNPLNVVSGDIPNCQQAGCPISDDYSSVGCVSVGSPPETYCIGDKTPLDKGCVPVTEAQAVASLGYNPLFHTSSTGSDFYTVTTHPAGTFNDTDDVTVAFDNEGITFDPDNDPCFQYGPGAFLNYINSCSVYADAAEVGFKDNHCCQSGVCSGAGMGECDTSGGNTATIADDGGCTSIMNNWDNLIPVSAGVSKNCHAVQAFECVALQELVNNCIQSNNQSECSACFVEIDSDFRYEFVPKSGESLVLVWLIEAVPDMPAGMNPNFNTYFYSMVRVFEQGGSELGLPTNIVHQKNFTSAFSVFGATSIDSSWLTPGKKYEIRVSYFIPNDSNIPLGEHLTMTVNRMELDVFRVRE